MFYVTHKHEPAHYNLFKPVSTKTDLGYDLAFYHRAAPVNSAAHHQAPRAVLKQLFTAPGTRLPTKTKASSAFYLRAEQHGRETIIGNMQIDARKDSPNWRASRYEITVGRPANIYKIMVQGAIREALRRKQERIIFQAGYANQLAQANIKNIETLGRELITPHNLAQHQKDAKLWHQQLAELQPGMVIYRPGNVNQFRAGTVRNYQTHADGTFLLPWECFEPLLLQVYDLSLVGAVSPRDYGQTGATGFD